MIGVLGSLAEYEREPIREKTALKRQASRANGTKFGRLRKVADAEHDACRSDPYVCNLIRVLTHNSSESLVNISVGGPDMLNNELHTVE